MNEEQIMNWMREKVKQDGFSDAATLASEFLKTHEIDSSLAPEFSKTLDAGFRVAQEVYGF